jgi:hypothetical protein
VAPLFFCSTAKRESIGRRSQLVTEIASSVIRFLNREGSAPHDFPPMPRDSSTPAEENIPSGCNGSHEGIRRPGKTDRHCPDPFVFV